MTEKEVTRARAQAHYEADFLPGQVGVMHPPEIQAAMRQAHALEYIAYNIGQISKKLDRLIEASTTGAK